MEKQKYDLKISSMYCRMWNDGIYVRTLGNTFGDQKVQLLRN